MNVQLNGERKRERTKAHRDGQGNEPVKGMSEKEKQL